MSAGWKIINTMRMFRSGAKLLSAAAVTVATTVTGVSKTRKLADGKDEIVFLSKEENSVPSTVKIVMQEIGENRDPVLPNGDLNWACACIERDVVGPCNLEFRRLSKYIHINELKADFETSDEEIRQQFDKLFEDFVLCTMDYPVYYENSMLDEEKEEIKKMEERKKVQEERKRQEKEANCRHFGKDEVVFLTKEENSTPSSVVIPKVQVEENRDPVLPNGDINWACTCIEKDVVGPCNIEFREFRKMVAKNRHIQEDEEMSEAVKTIVGNFIGCGHNNPVYYKSVFSEDIDEDEDDAELDQNSETKTER